MGKKILVPEISPEEMTRRHQEFMDFLRRNPNNFSYWFPHVEPLRSDSLRIPESVIIPVPEDIYKAFFMEQEGDSEKIGRFVMDDVVRAINNNPAFRNKKLFIKNGCFSGKFDFSRCCLIADPNDEETLIKNISRIQYDSLMHETDGYLELVLREYVEPSQPDTPSIYNGMPLRPEVRLFYAFDYRQPLYWTNYWDWDYCHEGICLSWDGERTPDADAYEAAWPVLKARTEELMNRHLPMIADALAKVTTLTMPKDMPNIWSVYFMLEDDHVWLIDMAQGWRSAYWDPQKAGFKPRK